MKNTHYFSPSTPFFTGGRKLAQQFCVFLLAGACTMLGARAYGQCGTWAAPGIETTQSNAGNMILDIFDLAAPNVVLDNTGTPYVFTDYTVKKLVGKTWVRVGSEASLAGAIGANDWFINNGTDNMAMDATHTVPYVVYVSETTGNLMVKKYDGSDWVDVGTMPTYPVMPNPLTATAYSAFPSIAVGPEGNVYAAFIEFDSVTVQRVKVIMYDGTSWSQIGNFDDGEDDPYSDPGRYRLLIDHAGALNIAFANAVLKYTGAGTWETAYSAADAGAPLVHMIFDNAGTPYIAREGFPLTVKKFVGGVWEAIGAPSLAGKNADWTQVSVDASGMPYVLYSNWMHGDKPYAMKYDGSNWVDLGGSGEVSPTYTLGGAIGFKNDGTPIAYYYCPTEDLGVMLKEFDGESWQRVSGAGLSVGEVYNTSVAVGSAGLPYAAFGEVSVPDVWSTYYHVSKANVMKYDGSTWAPIGQPSFRQIGVIEDDIWPYSALVADQVNIAVAGETPYISFLDGGAIGASPTVTDKASVMKYDGTAWQVVGDAGFTGTLSPRIPPSIAIDGTGTPYVAYLNSTTAGSVTTYTTNVMKYDGSAWVAVGAATLSAQTSYHGAPPSFALNAANVPYIAFRDHVSGTDSGISVLKYNGASWERVGARAAIHGTYSSMAMDASGNPWVAYNDYNHGGKTSVMKFDGTNWVVVGTAGFSAAAVTHTRIAMDGSNAYVTYADDANSGKATVMKYNGSSWAVAGSSAGISSGVVMEPTIAVGSGAAVYVGYGDQGLGQGFAAAGPAMVMELGGGLPGITGVPVACTGATTILANSVTGGTWSSSNTAIATVGAATGVVMGVGTGTATISYTFGSCSATIVVTVNSAGSITGGLAVCVGTTTTLGNAVSGGTWGSGNTALATIGSATGIVTGASAGAVTISYTNNGCVATALATVSGMVGVITGTASVCIGSSTALSSSFSSGAWSSGNVSVATVSGTGIVTGITNGTAIITYTVPGSPCNNIATVAVTVGTPSADAGTITGAASICSGAAAAFSSSATGGTWGSSNTAVATVGTGSGVVTGVAAGTATISYSVTSGCGVAVATAIVTVGATPSAGAITGTLQACMGTTTTLSNSVTGGTWGSSNAAVAVVNSTGVVTGITAGTAIISYTVSNSCGTATATAIVTVNPLANAGTITGMAGICSGAATTLSSSAAGGTWGSSNTAVAMVGTGSGVVTGVAVGTAIISYSVTSGCGVAVATAIVTVGATPGAGAITGTLQACMGTTTTLSNSVTGGTWGSSNAAVAVVNSTGVVTGITAGTAIISYTVSNSCGTATATAVVTVNPLANAGTITGAPSVDVGGTALLSDAVSGGTWSASNASATVSASGLVTGVFAGTAVISYTITNSCGTASATKVITINMATSGIMGSLSVCQAGTTTLSHAITGGTWSTSASVAIMSINASTGIVTGMAVGTGIVTYTFSGGTAIAVVTVSPLPLNISGAANVCLGAATTLTDATPAGSWLSNNTSIATANAATGIITGVAAGSTTITYMTAAGCYKTQPMAVKPLPVAITGAASACVGSTAAYADATTGGMSWGSNTPSVATIGAASGVLTAVSMGTTTITYTLATGCATTRVVSVTSLPAAISGIANACPGSTSTLSSATTGGTWSSSIAGVATVNSSTGVVTAGIAGVTMITYSTGAGCNRTAAFTTNPLPAAVTGTATLCSGASTALSDATAGGTWASGNTSVATVSPSGVVSGLSSGTSVITYALVTGCSRTATVTVSGSVTANTGPPVTCAGTAITLSNSTPGGAWASSNNIVATVNASGVVTGMAAGTVNISYSLSGGCRAVTTVTVNGIVPAITGAASVCMGATAALSNTTTGGTWGSSNAALATVSATGVVTGIAAGTPTITYALPSGCYRTMNITVKPLPGAISGNAGVCVGATSVWAAGTGLSWASGTPSVATIGVASGVITGIAPGTSAITFTAANSCTITRVVTVDAAASIPAITGASSVQVGHTVMLSDATMGGVWASNSPARATVSASGEVTGISAPAVTISYSVTNGACVATVTKLLTVTAGRQAPATTPVTAVTAAIYPNPTNGQFTVSVPGAGVFTLYTVDGRELIRSNVSAGDNIFNMPAQAAAGVYMCRFYNNDGGIFTARLTYE